MWLFVGGGGDLSRDQHKSVVSPAVLAHLMDEMQLLEKVQELMMSCTLRRTGHEHNRTRSAKIYK